MNTRLIIFVIALFVLAGIAVCATGVVLTARRRPYKRPLLITHKAIAHIAALGAILLAILGGWVQLAAPAGWLVAAGTVFMVVVAFASGGIIDAKDDVAPWIMWSHRALSWVTVLSMVVLIDVMLFGF